MNPGLFWRRSATAVGIYAGSGLGILATVFAARILGLEDFGVYATAFAAVGFFQSLLDLTFEEALTKYGFRYVTSERWGRLRRLFRIAVGAKLAGGLLAGVALVALAPFADAIFGVEEVTAAILAGAALPLVQAPENVAGTALLLRGRYDVRGWFLTLSMALRLAAVLLFAPQGVVPAMLAIVVAQVIATTAISAAGVVAFRRFPAAPVEPIADDRREITAFAVNSTAATGLLSLRSTLAPLLLGAVSSPTEVGLLRIAQAPQTGLNAASSPVRLILLTEQTRDWEQGERGRVFGNVRRYTTGAGLIMLLTMPFVIIFMPQIVELFFGTEYLDGVTAARIVTIAAAVHFAISWSKSLPVSIGRPGLRLLTHGIETVILLPLTVVLGAEWGVTGAAVAILASTAAFAVAWAVVLLRLRDAERALRAREALQA